MPNLTLTCRLAHVALLAMTGLHCTSVLYGQAVSARLEGIVQDQSKAVIPGVSIVVVNQETGLAFQGTSNESGRYIFATLPSGTYTASVEHTGFKKTVVKSILLQIGDAKTLDLTLTTGDVSDSVTVASESGGVDTTEATIGAVVANRQAVDLPLNGRDAMMLFYLQQGTNPLDRVASSQQQVGSVNGLATNTSSVKVEGINSSNGGYDYSPARPSTPVPQEAVGEYRVSTSTVLADAGRGSGAQVKVMIKSGTNQFHGSLFEFNRNTAYNANDFFNNRSGIRRPDLKRNQFGGALGGPIIRNKTFFFATAEWQRQVSATTENRVVYTAPLRAGQFRYLIGGTNSTSIVNAQGIPTVAASQIGTINLATVDSTRLGLDTAYFPKLIALMPLPNSYDLGDGLNTAGYKYNSSNPDNSYQVLFKIDHLITAKHHLAISGSIGHEEAPQPRLITGISPEGFTERRRGFSVRLISILTPHLTNELSVGANDRTSLRPITNDVNFPGVLGAGQETPAGNIQFAGLGTGSSLVGGTNGNINIVRSPQVNPAINKGFQDEMTWIKGNHTINLGGELWFETMNRTIGTNHYPVITTLNASNPANIPALTGLSSVDRAFAAQMANDVTGTIGSITQSFYLSNKIGFVPYTQNYEQMRKNESAWFIQDIWRVRPRLSINVGLRWEYLPPVTMANGVYVYPVDGVAGALGVQGPTGKPTTWGFEPGGGSGVFHTEKGNFGPSVGLAWDPFGDGKTAIRGAYRIAYDRFAMVNGDFSNSNYGTNTSVILTPKSRFSDPALYTSILPIATPPLFAPLGNVRTGNAYVADPNLRTPFVHLWNFTLEREVAKSWKVSASYVANHSVGMWRGRNLNQVNLSSNGFLSAFKIAQGNLAASGNPNTGASLGNLAALFRLIPAAQYNLITQGQAAALADFLDTNAGSTGTRGGIVAAAGLPTTFFRYNPQVQNLYITGNTSHSTYNGLQLAVNRRFDRGLYFQANYTFSKALADQFPGQNYTNDFRDVNNPGLDKSLSPYDATHVVLVNGIWEMPFGRSRKFLSNSGKLVDGVLGGWQLNGIFNYSSGRPVLITTGRFNLNATVASNPDFNGTFKNLDQVTKGPTQVRFLTAEQATAFSNPAAGSPGSLANYAFHGPGFSTFDASLFKRFALFSERTQLQLRVEFFNVLNHTSFQAPPATSLSTNSGSFGVLTSAYPARIGQFAMKLTF